jgi:hypothetical protein
MLSPGLSTHSSSHNFTPSFRNRTATSRTAVSSFTLGLRKTSYENFVGHLGLEG